MLIMRITIRQKGYWSNSALQMETAIQLGNNRKLFHFLDKANSGREVSGISYKRLLRVLRPHKMEDQLNHEAPICFPRFSSDFSPNHMFATANRQQKRK